MKRMERGFTITEILIAIVIVAVLAVMVIGRFTGHTERATVAEAVGILSAIRQAEAAWLLENPAGYQGTIANLDITIPAVGHFTYAVLPAAGPPLSFTATATRVPLGTSACTAANSYGGCTVTLTDTGAWGGSYDTSLRPT